MYILDGALHYMAVPNNSKLNTNAESITGKSNQKCLCNGLPLLHAVDPIANKRWA